MPLKIQSIGTSIFHQSINHCSVLQLWDLWNVFCMHLNLSQKRAGALQTSSRYQPALAQPRSLYTEGVCQKLPTWAWVDWEKFTVLRSGQGAWVSPQKGLFAIMGNIHPIKCLMVFEPWATQWKSLTGCVKEQVYSLCPASGGHWRHPLFYSSALLVHCREGPGSLEKRRELTGLSFQQLVRCPHLRNSFEAGDEGMCDVSTCWKQLFQVCAVLLCCLFSLVLSTCRVVAVMGELCFSSN